MRASRRSLDRRLPLDRVRLLASIAREQAGLPPDQGADVLEVTQDVSRFQVQRARAMYERVLPQWASDLLGLQARSERRPRWVPRPFHAPHVDPAASATQAIGLDVKALAARTSRSSRRAA
jgi:hypothetical protein